MADFETDPFFQYARTTAPTSEGNIDLPIFYYEASNLTSAHWVDLGRAQALVADLGFEAVRFENGKALAVIAFYEYRNTSIGSYREVGTAVAVIPKGLTPPKFPSLSLYGNMDKVQMGLYVVDLPVTTSAANVAGREIWGFPKFVTSIDFSLNDARFEGSVTDPDTNGVMLKLSGNPGIGVPGPLLDLVVFTRQDGKTIRTLVTTRGGARIRLPGSIRLEVSDSQHPMAQHLVALGLKNAKPALVSHTHALQLRLPAGAALP